jgi:hypothetical protein
MWSKILLTFCLAFPPLAFADEPEDISVPQFTFLDWQQPSPFRGTLFNPRATAELIAIPGALQAECDLEIEYQIDRQATDFHLRIDSADARYHALSEEYKLVTTQKDLELAELQRVIQTRSPSNRGWWIAGGAATGAVITLGIVYAALSASGKQNG